MARGLKGTLAQILVLSLALEVFAIAMPFFLQLVVDRVLVGRDRDLLTVLGVAFGALVVITVAVTAVRAWVSVYLSTNLNLRLLSTLFAHLVKLPLTWFEKRNIGDIVSKFRSVDAVQRTLTTTFVETMVDGLMVVLTLVVMGWYSLTLTAVVIGAALLYVAVRWLLYYPQRYATDEQLSHEAKSGTHFIETLRGMMAIKLNLRENERRAAYQNLVVDQINAGVKVQNVGIAQRAASALIFGLENVAVIWLGAIAVMDGKFSVGMLYAFLGFKLVFLARVNALVEKWNDFRMLDLHAERIADIALAEEEVTTAGAARGGGRGPDHDRGQGGELRLRAGGVRVPGRGLLGGARGDGGDRGAVGVRQDHAHQGAGGAAGAHRRRGAGERAEPEGLGPRPVPAADRRGDAGRPALRRHHRGQHQLLRPRARSGAGARMRAPRHDRRGHFRDAHGLQHDRRLAGCRPFGGAEAAGAAG